MNVARLRSEFEAVPKKPPLLITGMFGIGDCLHQRAVVRELMKDNDVWLETCHVWMHHDLVKEGLKLLLRPTKLWMHAQNVERERNLYIDRPPPKGVPNPHIWYLKPGIDKAGSILGAMFKSAMLSVPPNPDFSLPIKPEWREQARSLIATWDMGGKPLLLFRPIVQRKEWNGQARNPDPVAYAALFKSIRDKFFVVSIASLKNGVEWIVGGEQDADVKLHKGELDLETMSALFAEADLVFCNAGFAPVMAQAVGTPSIVVYGGRESFRTTQSAGAHLAPTLGINPDKPCDCHSHHHKCDKRITLAPALGKVMAFAEEQVKVKPFFDPVMVDANFRELHDRVVVLESDPRVLIYATTYVDSPDRKKLTEQWLTLHRHINPDCDFLVVDSVSPSPVEPLLDRHAGVKLYKFPDNIGHLSRGGKDGWGRAFCKGLEIAVERGYDYAVHIEGDSLLRLPVMPIVRQMREDGADVLSTPVGYGPKQLENWVETGLMFFRVGYVTESDFINRYDWQNRTKSPTPEVIVRGIVGDHLKMMSWNARRSDKQEITADNVLEFDWITHCHSAPQVYDRYVAAQGIAPVIVPAEDTVKINLGCGDNKLDGWANYDVEIDIEQPLPFADVYADYILIEHCVEHVDYYAAIAFFKECRRVLKPSGVLRVVVPSIEKIWKCSDPEYYSFTKRWGPSADARGAMHAILYAHGHKTAWTASLMEATLFYAGFDHVIECQPHVSQHRELTDVEGHHKVIGEKFNTIESLIFEGSAGLARQEEPEVNPKITKDYDTAFFNMHIAWKAEYEAIADILSRRLLFRTVVDLGCGNGFIISHLMKRRGKKVLGVDGSKSVLPFSPLIQIMDLTQPIEVGRHDLVICTEVAEHLEEQYADVLIDNICNATNKWVFFSAAKAGHGGHLHVNEQEKPYWIEKFEHRGFVVDAPVSEKIRVDLVRRTKNIWWFAANSFVVRRI